MKFYSLGLEHGYSLGSDFGPFDPILSPKNFFRDFYLY